MIEDLGYEHKTKGFYQVKCDKKVNKEWTDLKNKQWQQTLKENV